MARELLPTAGAESQCNRLLLSHRDRVSAIKQNLDRKVQTDTRNLKKRYHKVISEFSVL